MVDLIEETLEIDVNNVMPIPANHSQARQKPPPRVHRRNVRP